MIVLTPEKCPRCNSSNVRENTCLICGMIILKEDETDAKQNYQSTKSRME